jgi:hypothetical protein
VIADDHATTRIDPLVTTLKSELSAIGATVAEETGPAMRLDAEGNESQDWATACYGDNLTR